MVECTRLESEQTVKGLGSSNLPLSEAFRTLLRRLALAGAIAGAGSLPLAAAAESSSTFGGRVVDSQSNRPIAGARVHVESTFDDRSTATRADGTFGFLGLNPASGVVTIDVAGYEPRQCAYRFYPGGNFHLRFVLAHESPAALTRGTSIREAPGAPCPQEPLGGGATQDVYVIGS